MNAENLTDFMQARDEGNDGPLDFYWSLEEAISLNRGHTWSDLDLRDPELRRCRVCRSIAGTLPDGSLPPACQKPNCAPLWSFWNLSTFPRPTNHCQSRETKSRRGFLCSWLSRINGSQKLSEVPGEILYELLLTAMVERIAYEAQH